MIASSGIITQTMQAAAPATLVDQNSPDILSPNNCSHCPAGPYPPFADVGDYEIQVHINFQAREMRLLRVLGVVAGEGADVLLFTREKCRDDCEDRGCTKCRTRKLYQDRAGDPQGAVPYTPHQEYLYCLRFGKQPVTALLALTPREQDVQVQEKGVMAYWFMKWLERDKMLNSNWADGAIKNNTLEIGTFSGAPITSMETDMQKRLPPPPSYNARSETKDSHGQLKPGGHDADDYNKDDVGKGQSSEECLHKQTSAYLPNMQIVYQVKNDQLGIVLPKPMQLTRPIDIILVSHEEGNSKVQSVTMEPGALKSSNSLVAVRNVAYTLRVQLHNRGNPIDLLDFITEQKILRVQESKDAPKQLNFLIERLVEHRGTYVLHITFDEKIVDVGTKPLGEFYVDVDVDTHRMAIGTTKSHASKHYRVEKVLKDTNPNILLAEKQLLFEDGVDPESLTIHESIPIERMSDYLITVVDPVTKQSLPTSVLSFQRNALYVKEIKNSEVRLHVSVQRQPTISQSSNANNRRTINSSLMPVGRQDPQDPTSPFQCAYKSGSSGFRIYHATTSDDILAHACRRSVEDKSTSPLDNIDTAETSTLASSALPAPSIDSLGRSASMKSSIATSFNLDVDLPALKARLLPGGDALGAPHLKSMRFVIYEESFDGKLRSTPCIMGQAFKLKHWCKYKVKCVEAGGLSPLLTFCITDKEVADVCASSSCVRLSKRFVYEVV